MNTSVGRSPLGAPSTMSRLHWTTAPIARNASRCGSRRRRPMTSPPGGDMIAWWKRASSGPARRNDARIRSACSSGTSTSCTAAAHSATSLGPRQAISTPMAVRMLSIVSTSRIRGTLFTTTSSSVRSAAARIASAPFLLPAGVIVPDRGTPPSMTNFSMSCTRRRRTRRGPANRCLASVTAISAVKFAPPRERPACRHGEGDRAPACPADCKTGCSPVPEDWLRRAKTQLPFPGAHVVG